MRHRNRTTRHSGLLLLGFPFNILTCLFLVVISIPSTTGRAISPDYVSSLRRETEDLFYHGYENYMRHAFPEDEIRPITCKPLTRDRDNPAHVEVNDVLGNYSLTLVDNLSTLAILASSETKENAAKALRLFQDGVVQLVEQYGDGTSHGPKAQGKRAKGFDLDSKVQVFETVIRGVGGLLSAHLFAVGQLPIRGYAPSETEAKYAQRWPREGSGTSERYVESGIQWPNGMVYDGQLLGLAYDLGQRLLPAFWSLTGIPYPRVNLRDGIPFYTNSPRNINSTNGQCFVEKQTGKEITETCSAGAGSLVLEFTVLSRLTGDARFEDLAKRAFWSIWARRSEIDLVGAGVDAETGDWVHSWTGIGAGIDSFFEYALKSHILLGRDDGLEPRTEAGAEDPRQLFTAPVDAEHSPSNFLAAWDTAHAAVRKHLRRGMNYQHPHYVQADLMTGAARGLWVDALSAFYPGLLALGGHVDEAIEAHLLQTALWTRFSALPERWSLATGGIEGGLGWWVGRPEFVESNYYIYRATEDPWYLHVGEMVLRDIRRRSWAPCGWASIQNVITGEQTDRMESFFISETAKYLYLLFDETHPLNHWDAPFVFTTEGHPLIIPKLPPRQVSTKSNLDFSSWGICPARPERAFLAGSATAARGDVYHAASLARLHQMPEREIAGPLFEDTPLITSPSNFTHFPWTLPLDLIPIDGHSTPMLSRPRIVLGRPVLWI